MAYADPKTYAARAVEGMWRQLGGKLVGVTREGTVASLEIKKPSGKWEKVSGASYKDVAPDPETGTPRGLGLVSTTGISKLMRDNKDRQIFGKLSVYAGELKWMDKVTDDEYLGKK